jgi:hypothetical protein
VTLDTVNNLVPMDPTLDLFGLLGLLHSDFVNWFVYSVIYNKAIRTMHFDQYFLNKIPLPDGFASLLGQLAPLAQKCCNATQTIASLAGSFIEEVKKTTGGICQRGRRRGFFALGRASKRRVTPQRPGALPRARGRRLACLSRIGVSELQVRPGREGRRSMN